MNQDPNIEKDIFAEALELPVVERGRSRITACSTFPEPLCSQSLLLLLIRSSENCSGGLASRALLW
jgi:hypothetical protein